MRMLGRVSATEVAVVVAVVCFVIEKYVGRCLFKDAARLFRFGVVSRENVVSAKLDPRF